VQDYYRSLFDKLPGYSPSLADHFRIGDDFEAQMVAREVFIETLRGTLAHYGITSMHHEIEPFTETEFVTDMLTTYARKELIDPALATITTEGGAGEWQKNQIRNLIITAVEKVAGSWDAVADKAREASVAATKKVQEGAGKFAEMLREPLAKIVAIVQEKMKEKEEKGGDEEDKGGEEKEVKGLQIGDIAKNWSFVKTEIGKQLDGALDGKQKPSEAIQGSVDGIKSALSAGVRGPLEKLADSLTGGQGGNRFVAKIVNGLVNRITNFILELTTLDGFLESSIVIAGVLDGVEEKLGKCADKAAATKAIDEASHALWESGIKKVAMTLWTRIWKLQEKIASVMSSLPEEASAPLIDLLGHLFEVQLRAFNGIRIQYIRNLRESVDEIKDAESATRISRAAFKGAFFPIVNLLGYHHWLRAHEALYESARAVVMHGFNELVWPAIAGALEPIQACIPEELGTMGLKLENLVRSVCDFIINKALTWIMTKIFLAIERALYAQESY